MTTTIDAATRYAALNAIAAGIAEEQKAAAAALREWSATSGVTKGTVETPFGPVTLKENKASRTVAIHDERAFIEWAKANHPDAIEVVEQIRPKFRDAILADRFVAVAGTVFDNVNGEAVEFAEVVVVEAAPPSPSYGASDRQREAKAAARRWVHDRAAGLVQIIDASMPKAVDGATEEAGA